MNFPFFIAKRYFFSKQSNSFITLASWISVFGIAVGTAALIVVLSVFNGFEDLVVGMYNKFDPELKIIPVKGKDFLFQDVVRKLELQDSSLEYAIVLEEQVLVKYEDREYISTIKGVSESYRSITEFDSTLIIGEYFDASQINNAVIGEGIAYHLSASTMMSYMGGIELYAANRKSRNLLNPSSAFRKSTIIPVGIFRIQVDIDNSYIILPLNFVSELIQKQGLATAIELKISKNLNIDKVQSDIQKQIGSEYIVQNRLQQQTFLYKILNSEKLAVFLILIFILIIAAFNIIGSLTMFMLEKKEDIRTFWRMGIEKEKIEKVFFLNSIFIILSGTSLGLLLGLLTVFAQMKFELLKMHGGFVVDAYPVAIHITDILSCLLIVLCVGLITSWIPSRLITKRLINQN